MLSSSDPLLFTTLPPWWQQVKVTCSGPLL